MTKPLSSGAQAVLNAFISCPIENSDQSALAAALRAAADQLYDSPSVDYLWDIAKEIGAAH
jgi:hypothetical protein